jgi:hypothetical protein
VRAEVVRRLLAAVLCCLVLTLTSCGDDAGQEEGAGDDSMNSEAAREAAAAQSLSDAFYDEMGDDEDLPITPTQASCMGVDMVEKIGVDELQAAGLLTNDLEAPKGDTAPLKPEMAATAAEVTVACIGSKLFADLVIEGAGDVPAEIKQCIRDTIDDALMREVFAAVFTDDEEDAEAKFTSALEGCQAASA